jgi:hypothetical protein
LPRSKNGRWVVVCRRGRARARPMQPRAHPPRGTPLGTDAHAARHAARTEGGRLHRDRPARNCTGVGWALSFLKPLSISAHIRWGVKREIARSAFQPRRVPQLSLFHCPEPWSRSQALARLRVARRAAGRDGSQERSCKCRGGGGGGIMAHSAGASRYGTPELEFRGKKFLKSMCRVGCGGSFI